MRPRRRPRPQPDALDALIDEAITDAYSHDEQTSAFLVCLQERVRLPFTTTVLGAPVDVIGFDEGVEGGPVAICRRGKNRLRVSLAELPVPMAVVAGYAWIRAYRCWLGKDRR